MAHGTRRNPAIWPHHGKIRAHETAASAGTHAAGNERNLAMSNARQVASYTRTQANRAQLYCS